MDYYLPGDSLLELVRLRQASIRAEADRQRLARTLRSKRQPRDLLRVARRLRQAMARP